MKKLDVITGWMESDPSENEVKRVESLVQRLIVSRSRRESYEIERKKLKMMERGEYIYRLPY